jgi:hypothetical protein
MRNPRAVTAILAIFAVLVTAAPAAAGDSRTGSLTQTDRQPLAGGYARVCGLLGGAELSERPSCGATAAAISSSCRGSSPSGHR